ncbi:MAG: hypothetical protein F4X11_13560 [Acidobacteria bacterium]|nr:hypothetical protein [Acidobacteriota bacterium]
MTDYRSFVESKRADLVRRREALDRQLQEIDNEQQRLEAALSVLDEADASREASLHPASATVPLPAATLKLITRDGMMTTDDLWGYLSQERDITRGHLHTALYRLKKRGTIFKSGNAWGLVGRDDKGAESEGQGDSSSLLTTPPNAF